jgi:hypothetical protein
MEALLSEIYADDLQYLDDVLALTALRLHREVLITRALRGDGRNESFLGLFLCDNEVDAMLSELHGNGTADPAQADAAAAACGRRIGERMARIGARVAATPRPLPPQRLADTFELSNPEVDLVLYLLAAEVDDRFGRVYGYLHDDMGRRRLSPGLAYRLLGGSFASMAELRGVLHPSAPLLRGRIVVVDEEGAAGHLPLMERPIRIEDPIVDFLLGCGETDRALHGLIERVPAEAEPEYAADVRLVHASLSRGPGVVCLSLHRDSDADLWAGSLAASLGLREVVTLDWRRLRGLDPGRQSNLVHRAAREARLQRALLHLSQLDQADDSSLRQLAGVLHGVACLSARQERDWAQLGVDAVTARAVPLTRHARARHWAAVLLNAGSGGAAGDGAATPDRPAIAGAAVGLAAAYPVPLRDMRAVVRSAPECPHGRGAGELAALVAAACRRMAALRMEGAARRVSTPFRFHDLVLPDATLDLLRELVVQQRHSATVLSDWGLGERFHQAHGNTALFMGPSGTGKTMAASVVANELGLELFRVDLSGVVSKYIGETEKNLDRVFDAASRSRIVLFIDEADALFGKRSEVKDAHDRYANIEVSFLLQRMEEYDGIAILATNLGQNMDEAFLRRIRSVVEFPLPGAPDRLRLWQRLADSAAPLGDDVDLVFLADRFELSGGHIRNCILSGALNAAAGGDAIRMEHLARAVGREYVKIGRPISRTTFGPYYAMVRRNGVP